ncbi:MAG: lytic murein transglycosylase [Proteobacteria bacterium]|nr:lytic murein transglycosylase [Desulfobulbaceae bacterium]MBU4152343.1 lytic murein transglycosylase [Pseudomonadota bacterium]
MVVFPRTGLAKDKSTPLAADLVEDGQAIDLSSERYVALFKDLREQHGFSQEELLRLFYGVSIQKRVLELMDRQSEALPYFKYYPIFIKKEVVAEGRRQLEKHKVILDSVEKEIGVEREIVVAIWGIESRYGKHKGAYNMFRTLNTMFDAYPRRRDFYRQQLVEYLLLCRENSVDYVSVTGSYGAAFGQTQFIPSSFRQYAVDFDHDGKRDVWESVPDILASIANYLHSFGWTMGAPITAELGRELKDQRLVEAFSKGRSGLLPWSEVGILQQVSLPQQPGERKLSVVGLELEEGDMRYVAGYPNFQAITKWNNSNRYAMAVTELAAMLKEGGGM